MRSERATRGKRVRVRPDYRKAELRGLSGIIERRYGSPEYTAVEVRFGDGDSQLFWHHEVDEEAGEPAGQHWWHRVLSG